MYSNKHFASNKNISIEIFSVLIHVFLLDVFKIKQYSEIHTIKFFFGSKSSAKLTTFSVATYTEIFMQNIWYLNADKLIFFKVSS